MTIASIRFDAQGNALYLNQLRPLCSSRCLVSREVWHGEFKDFQSPASDHSIAQPPGGQEDRFDDRLESCPWPAIEVHRFAYHRVSGRLPVFCVLAAAILGCDRGPDVPAGDNAAEGIRRLTLAYVQYAATNRGVGPANQASLAKFVMQRNRLSKADAEAYFVSPRDNQPYIVRWGQRPLGSAPTGPDPPTPAVIVFETTGASGTRYVADGQVAIKQMSADELAKIVPEQMASGN